jgi:3-deoxy-7-phosphoheptulonate synthase
MVVVMQEHATEEQIQGVIGRLREDGFQTHRSDGASRTVIGAIGVGIEIDTRRYELLPGVYECLRITEEYKLASRGFREEDTVVDVGGVRVGGAEVVLMAGPCTVESEEQVRVIARRVHAAGAKILRGGAFKPRSSPYSFQGLGEQGLKLLRAAADENGMKVVSEVMDVTQIDLVSEYSDILQVGARNMQNFSFLKELGKSRKPILLKRGLSATIKELLLSAEYIMSGGNHQVLLCERGIRTFETATRNTLDISAIPVLKSLSHLPVIVDPSHATGLRDKVPPVARAGVAAGADGLLIEVHHDPDHALCDGPQALLPDQLDLLVGQLRTIAGAIGRGM